MIYVIKSISFICFKIFIIFLQIKLVCFHFHILFTVYYWGFFHNVKISFPIRYYLTLVITNLRIVYFNITFQIPLNQNYPDVDLIQSYQNIRWIWTSIYFFYEYFLIILIANKVHFFKYFIVLVTTLKIKIPNFVLAPKDNIFTINCVAQELISYNKLFILLCQKYEIIFKIVIFNKINLTISIFQYKLNILSKIQRHIFYFVSCFTIHFFQNFIDLLFI
jgi:hypothetical protein